MAEADSLAQTPFGPTMLRAIGGTYRSQAEIALGNFFEGSVAAMRSKGAAFKSQMHAAGLALKVRLTGFWWSLSYSRAAREIPSTLEWFFGEASWTQKCRDRKIGSTSFVMNAAACCP